MAVIMQFNVKKETNKSVNLFNVLKITYILKLI